MTNRTIWAKPGGWLIQRNANYEEDGNTAWQHDWPEGLKISVPKRLTGGGWDGQDRAIEMLRELFPDRPHQNEHKIKTHNMPNT